MNNSIQLVQNLDVHMLPACGVSPRQKTSMLWPQTADARASARIPSFCIISQHHATIVLPSHVLMAGVVQLCLFAGNDGHSWAGFLARVLHCSHWHASSDSPGQHSSDSFAEIMEAASGLTVQIIKSASSVAASARMLAEQLVGSQGTDFLLALLRCCEAALSARQLSDQLELLPRALKSMHLAQHLLQNSELTTLKLSASADMQTLPPELAQLSALEKVHLEGMQALTTLPEELCMCTRLRSLSIVDCAHLRSLPEHIGQLRGLQLVHLRGSTALAALPSSFASLSELWWLDLRHCSSLSQLPTGVCQLPKLRVLLLSGCSQLASLPPALGQHSWLSRLAADSTPLHSLPDALGGCSRLHHLSVADCDSLQSLPSTLCRLPQLQSCSISGTQMQQLPSQLAWQSSLSDLRLGPLPSCTSSPLRLSSLPGLRRLIVRSCLQLAWPAPEQPSGVESLTLTGMPAGAVTAALAWCTQLTSLELCECVDVQTLACCSALHATQLRSLRLLRCTGLTSMEIAERPCSQAFAGLTHLAVLQCPSLLDACIACMPPELHSLHLSGCNALTRIENPEHLFKLSLQGCSSLVTCVRAHQGSLAHLAAIDLDGCLSMRSLPHSPAVLSISARSCLSLGSRLHLPGFCDKLCQLDLSGCHQIQELDSDVLHAGKLTALKLNECSALRRLPSSPSVRPEDIFTSLQVLECRECESLAQCMDFLRDACALTRLDLQGCTNVRMGDMQCSKPLCSLSIRRCHQMQSLEWSKGFSLLTELDCGQCTGLQALPAHETWPKLRKLYVDGCTRLQPWHAWFCSQLLCYSGPDT